MAAARKSVKGMGIVIGVFFVITCLASVLFPGCKKQETKRVMAPPDVTVCLPVQKEVVEYLELNGNTQALETVNIVARVKGFLTKILFMPRERVKKDQLLFVIDPRQYQAAVEKAKGTLASRKANLQFAEFDYKRLQGLSKQDVAAEYELIQSQTKRDSALASVAVAEADLEEAQLNLSYTQVVSPIDGRIGRNLVDIGNLVGASGETQLATIVHDDPIYAYFSMSEDDMLMLIRRYGVRKSSDPVRMKNSNKQIPAELGVSDETGYPHPGYVDYFDTQVDPNTGTLNVRAVFENSAGLILSGMFVRVRVPTGREMALLVPDVALSADQGGRFLLVLNDKNVVQYRPVKIGTLVGTLRVIHSGLSAGERVVVNGLQRARPGSTVTPKMATLETPASKPVSSTQSVK
jgi:membrane fusion protein, multidrug efflux system